MRMYSSIGRVGSFTVALVVAACPEAPAGQTVAAPGQPTFRAAVDVIEVAVSVTDENGRPVLDLTADDFEVYEDGRRQPVVAFTRVDTPVEPFDAPVSHPPPDAASSAPGERDGRVYLLLLDDLHTHVLRTEEVRAIAREFIENTLFGNDLAAVAMTSGLGQNQHFTNDRQRLLEAVDRFVGRYAPAGRLRSWPPDRSLGSPAVPGPARVDRERETKARDARRMLRSVERFAGWMGGLDARRKAMILIGQGIDYDTRDVFGDRNSLALLDETLRVADVAARHNVTLYAVDPRGLPTGRRSAVRTRVLVDETSEATWRGKQSLRALAEETGGFAFINSNQFGQAFDRIVREQSSYFLLGYRAPREAPDGRLHHIRIEVNRPGVTINARRSYVHTRVPEEPHDITARMSALLDSPLPQSGLRLELTALPLRGDDPDVQPLVVALRLQPAEDGGGSPAVDSVVSVIAADPDGAVLAGRSVEVSLPGEMRGLVREHGLRVLSRLDLPGPGRVHLRAAVVERLTGIRGSVHHEMEIPDLRSASIAMSGLAVNPDLVAPVPTVIAESGLESAVPFPPAARRVFDADDTLAVFAEIYVNGSGARRWLGLTRTISDAAGASVLREREEVPVEDGSARYGTSLPLEGLRPGAYVLRVEAVEDETGLRVGRQVPFRVR